MNPTYYNIYKKQQLKKVASLKIVRKRLLWFVIAIIVLAIGVAATLAFAITPANGGSVGGSTIAVDNTGGDQTDPHVSGNIAAYTDASDPTASVIRYYDFLNPVSPNAAIPAGSVDDVDTLSDVNGNHIAFSRFNSGTGTHACMVFNVVTTNTVQIGSGVSARSTALGSDTVAFVNASAGNGEIMVGRISDPSAPLTNLSSSSNSDESPAVSPDGTLVVWASCVSPLTNCSIMKSTLSGGVWSAPSVVMIAPTDNPDTDGTNIVYESGGDIFYEPAGGGAATQLEIDGVQRNPSIATGVIAFESATDASTPADLFVYRISTNTLFRVTDTPAINESLNDIAVLANGDVRTVWAADDDVLAGARNIYARTFALPGKIAFASFRDGNQDIYLMNPDGSNQTRVTNHPASDFQPAFSPDGAKIAFVSNRDGNLEIYVMNADGSNQTRLTFNDDPDDFQPSFSSDGTQIAFTSYRDFNAEIYVMNVDGSNQTRRTINPALDHGPSFSPDGSKIAFTSERNGNEEIYVMNANGSSQTRLTVNSSNDWGPSFSPNGSQIAFVSDRNGNEEIYMMNANGSSQTRLTNNPANDSEPSFSPDGAQLAFRSDRDGIDEIYVMHADGSSQTNLTVNPAFDINPSWGNSLPEPTPTPSMDTSIVTYVHDSAHNDITNQIVVSGAYVHDNAIVSGEVNGIPLGGTVTFYFYPHGNGLCIGPNEQETVPVGSETTPRLMNTSGNYAYSAIYNGDANYNASAESACEPFTVQAAPPPPTLGNYDDTSVRLGQSTTITPSTAPIDTTSINVSTTPSFKGNVAADPVTGVVRVTNAHPANIPPGSYPVTVTAFGPGGMSTRNFNLTVTNGAACAWNTEFSSPANPSIGVRIRPSSVAVADFNNDGNQDFAAANFGSNNVSIRLGDGVGGFTSPAIPEISVAMNPRSVAVGDFNNDGKQDFAAANFGSNNVSIRLGDGAGGFTAPAVPEITVGSAPDPGPSAGSSGPVAVAIGDFNNDGKQDFATANNTTDNISNGVSIRLGDGAGGFTSPAIPEIAVGTQPIGLAIGDFNNDGKRDFAVANYASSNVSIRLGNGAGGFTSPASPEITVGVQPFSVAIGDFNDDGIQDFAAANSGSGNVSIRLGNGAGGFTTPASPEITVGTQPTSVAVGDFNNDSRQDLATANFSSRDVSIRLGDGAGGFTSIPEVTGFPGVPVSIAVGDFNSDGKQDFAAANPDANPNTTAINPGSVAIRLGACVIPPTLGNYDDTTVVLSQNATITPSAAPANVTSINVSTTLSFNGELAADPLTGVVRVTNAHPANIPPDAYPITVTAFGPGGMVTKSFRLTVIDGTPCLQNTQFFSSPTPDMAVGIHALSVAVGDFNNDGRQDFATANSRSNSVSIGLGDGTGGFTLPAIPAIAVGENPRSIAVGDFNNDGRQDFATANSRASTVSIRLGDGVGGFGSPAIPEITVGSAPDSDAVATGGLSPSFVVVADFNKDGKQDFATTNVYSNTVSIRLGDGAGGFTAPQISEIAVGSGPASVAVGDFNKDGKQDFATANLNSNDVSIRLGDGAGGFTSSAIPEIAVGTQPNSITVADFNKDGKEDLAAANSHSNNVSIRLGDGGGGFTSPASPEITVGIRPLSVAIGDFNNDGKQDFVSANLISGDVSIRLGDGTGGFTSIPEITGFGELPVSVAVGDFNNDGRQDFAATTRLQEPSDAGANPAKVSIRLGGCCVNNPVVTTNADSGAGSLRQAVIDSCSGSTITFAGSVTSPITLLTGQIVIDKDLSIQGPGATSLTVSGNNTSRIFAILSGVRVNISGMTLTHGNSNLDPNGGGAIYNFGTLNLTNSTISDNEASCDTCHTGSAWGGGIFNAGTLIVTNSTVSANTVGNTDRGYGGGIANHGTVRITNSTISDNVASGLFEAFGGGIANAGSLNLTNVTLSANDANGNGRGGGIFNYGNVPSNIKNTIIAGNSAGLFGPDLFGEFTSSGCNLIGKVDDSTGFSQPTDQTGTIASPLDAMLGPLQFNGGSTLTHGLLPGSPAIDKGASATDPVSGNPITNDQRGMARPVDLSLPNAAGGNGSDIGAFEAVDITPPVITPQVSGTLGNNGWYTSNIQVSWSVVDHESTVGSQSGCDTTTISSDTSSVTLTCTATSAGGTDSQSVTIKRDATAPTLAPTVSPNPVSLNGTATATPNASDNLSGIASQSCGAVNTSTVGNHSVVCTATDNAGNTANSNANYQVIYNFEGFFQPVDNLPTLNIASAGSAIAVNFSLGGYQGLAIFAPGYPSSGSIPCDASNPDAIEETVNAGGSSLSYNATTDQYTYIWKTDKAWKGTCRMLVVKLNDNTEHLAKFKFR